MYTILIKTKPWICEFTQKEIISYSKKTPNLLNEGLFELKIEDDKEMFEIVINLIYYSRTIENIFLKVTEFKKVKELSEVKSLNLDFIKKEFTFEVDAHGENKSIFETKIGKLLLDSNKNLTVNLKIPELSFKVFSTKDNNILGLDLVGFKLSRRDYKLNINSTSINSLIPNYCMYLLGMDEEENLSVIDPVANLGEIINEVSLFNPRKAMNLKLRHNFPICKIFGLNPQLPKNIDDKNKYVAVVQNNKIFKEIRENINFSGQKIKVSQYELDWLDVKFKKNDHDYVISQFPSFQDEEESKAFQKEFFYQAEFICKKKIGLISKKEINMLYLRKYRLRILRKEIITVGEQNYNIYIISKGIGR